MTSTLDDVLGTLSLEDRLELVRRVRVGALTLRGGDRVVADRRLRGWHLDENLEADGEDCREPYDVPAGALGRVLVVRQYVTPFPYRVTFDSGVELSLAPGDVVRTDEQPSTWEREQDETLWHIPEGEFFRSRCSRWIERVGRPCPQLPSHRGPCGLPPRR
ncbi:hypothetical protein [Streptomyces sp. SID13726]|uniref:hypothetical protein n=1 Tax=Streptomyces sp. SID13726 TaxID=2706058 RepID=UPI0013B78086|nr:hypothetical protein [Streptomyces sp. SID13726]NEB06468.1 hypothetical protein [Streptomyces sp. SID13726]